MQFLYQHSAGSENIILDNEDFHYIFNVRRKKINDNYLILANMQDSTLYKYEITKVEKKKAILNLISSQKIIQKNKNTHIIQAVIDMNEFHKTLPYLNELLVDKITLFYSDFSQKNEKVNIEKLNKILINSSMQCSRLSIMAIEILNNLEDVLDKYKDAIALDFNNNYLNIKQHNSFIIGPEGGFSKKEKQMLINKSFGINNPLIMRAKTAAIFIAANKI